MFDIGTIFPYSDLHKLNLDWILQKVSQLDDFEKEINDYIDKTLPGVIQTEVNKQIIQFAIHTYYSEEDHSLNFGIDTGTVVYDAVHYIDDETLNIIEKKEG